MAKRTWPALKSCKQQQEKGDPLTQLPHDILLSIMCTLSIKEAARTSALSRSWRYLWLHLPVLIFQADSSAKPDGYLWLHLPVLIFQADSSAKPDEQLLPLKRSGFTRWVNSVVEAHLGSYIDELRVNFDLDVNCQSDIDKWVVFAITKRVKRLGLDFTPLLGRRYASKDCYTWPLERLMSLNLSSLTSLCLKYINVTEQDIGCVLDSCLTLEELCIVGGSIYLTEIKYTHSALQLKKLEVSCCPHMKCIDIWAPKLVSFASHGQPIKTYIKDASLLREVLIGCGGDLGYGKEVVANAVYYLWSYLPQLVYLSFDILIDNRGKMYNLGIDNPRTMRNLKHLELRVSARCDRSLLGWASLIEASPSLEKLTLKFPEGRARRFSGAYNRDIVRRKGRPLKNLKTVEHVGILGVPLEYEFLTYVVENSVMLKQVIHFVPRTYSKVYVCRHADKCIEELKRTLPQGVYMQQPADLLESIL